MTARKTLKEVKAESFATGLAQGRFEGREE